DRAWTGERVARVRGLTVVLLQGRAVLQDGQDGPGLQVRVRDWGPWRAARLSAGGPGRGQVGRAGPPSPTTASRGRGSGGRGDLPPVVSGGGSAGSALL